MSKKEKLLFPSEEWAQANVKKINSNEAYATAAATWEGDFFFVIEPDESGPKDFDEPIVMYMDLWHGKCRKSYLVTPDNPAPEKVEYEWSGKYSNWLQLLKGEAKDPVKALMQRKFKLKGNMAKILKAVKAAKELVRSATLVEEDYDVEYL
ncbi:MAG: SCP2 sterol-binding domain-containing protein [Candidatus Hodarchaeota archaeon]